MREDVIGRANVEDTPELDRYYQELGRQESYALWTVANSIEPWHPQPTSLPQMWSYKAMRPLVLQALDLVSPEKAGRRVIALENPGRKGTSACVGWLYTGLQVMKPGESATAHSHASSALRFIIEGKGAYTVVDGHKMDLAAGDFVITPNGTWHDHGVESDGAVTIWQDGLDMLLVNQLDANFYAVHPDRVQKSNHPLNDSTMVYGGPGLLPAGGEAWSKPYSPLLKYEWGRTYETLVSAAKATDGSPYDGIMMQYVNPATGGPVMKTLGAHIQLLRGGERTKAHRHTGSVVYTCAKGSGYSIIGGKRYDWSKSDIFVVPSWAMHEHANASERDDAVLFSFTRHSVDGGARPLSRRESRRQRRPSESDPLTMTIRQHHGDLPDLSRYTGPAVAIDTEAMGLDPRRDRLCVVQLSPGDGSADVVQIPTGNVSAPNLKKLMSDTKILKIFHFARFDIGMIFNTLGVMPAPVYCTQDRFAPRPHLHRPARAQGSRPGAARPRHVEAAAILRLGRRDAERRPARLCGVRRAPPPHPEGQARRHAGPGGPGRARGGLLPVPAGPGPARPGRLGGRGHICPFVTVWPRPGLIRSGFLTR